MGLDWNNNDMGGYPYFAIGANSLCDSVTSCVSESDNFELSLDQFYYSFPVYAPQDCDTTSNQVEEDLFPYQYRVSSPYPNPFNPTMKIDLIIPYDRRMDIRVYDLLGNEIHVISNREIYKQGIYTLTWSGDNHPSGIYFIKFEDWTDLRVRKIILAKY